MRSSLIPHRSVVSRALSTAREWLCNRRTSRYVVRPSARGEGRGPVAPPVFKTGLSLLVGDGRFDSFPSPPLLAGQRLTPLSPQRCRATLGAFRAPFPHPFPIRR